MGAFKWIAQSEDCPNDYGSQNTVKELLKANKLGIYNNGHNYEIYDPSI